MPGPFDFAAEFGVLAGVEHQPGQAERLAWREFGRQYHDDVLRSLHADDGGRA